MKSKKILMICPFARPNMGGVETHLDKLLEYLAKKKVFCYLLTYQPLTVKLRGEKVEYSRYYEIHRYDWFGQGLFNKLENHFVLSFSYLFPGLFMKSLFFYLKHKDEISCIHAHGLSAAAMAKLLSAVFPVRTVVSTHAIYNFERRKSLALIITWLLSSFDEILAVSEISRRELVDIGIAQGKIKVHPNWIDLKRFIPLEKEKCKKRLGLSGMVVLFVGRMIEKKGILFLLEAARKFAKIKFIFVGSGPLEQTVREASAKSDNVTYVGRLSQENDKELKKLVEYYSAADLFASIPTYEEGFGAVYLEAISCGTPVLSSHIGSLPTFLDESVAELIDPTQKSVNQAIEELFFTRSKKLGLMTENCRDFAEKNFSEKNAEVIYDSYVLNNGSECRLAR